MKIWTLLKIFLSFLCLELPVFIFMSNLWVNFSVRDLCFDSLEEVPPREVGLILGTMKGSDKYPNYYFKYRVEAAAELYHAGKIKKILASGDNSRKDYNEPQDMKDALIKLGVPDSVIYLDYAGFRTFDSMYRAKAIFGLCSFTVISQEFHNERAIFIANQLGIDAIGYNAKNLGGSYNRWMIFRESIARTAAVGDLYVWFKKPYFLGKREYLD
ncbi:MAG: YdcF family protein [Crocinitomicaceae bacterium]|nr:YdcF family protein [Crocinitomicaceae bacterium]